MTQRECTAEEGARWQRERGEGYAAGRGDITWNSVRADLLMDEPPGLPDENGAQYVARHVGSAWRLGYSAAVRYEQQRAEQAAELTVGDDSPAELSGIDFRTMRAQDFDTSVPLTLFDVADGMGRPGQADRYGTQPMFA